MIRDLVGTHAPSRVVFESVACALLALTVPLSGAPALDASAAGTAVVALLLGMLVAFAGTYTARSGGAVATQSVRSADQCAARSAEIIDPPHHPLRPRAPGLV